MITNIELELLKSYKVKSYIMGLLCEQSYNYYSFVKNMINIPLILINTSVKIYSGKSWHRRNINKWMIGFKFGEFTWNRKLALYKAKQLKKKKKK